MGLPGWLRGQESKCQVQERQVPSLGWEDSLEEEMATHSSILAWGIPRTEEPGGLQSMGSKRIRHGLVTKQQEATVGYMKPLYSPQS